MNIRRLLTSVGVTRNLTSNMSSHIKTFIFIDLETTGLPQYEHNRTKITELCAIAVQADHLELGVFPRVCSKVSMCFNPCKLIDPVASEITGLSNACLEKQPKFSSGAVDILNNFLDLYEKPLCFVAHNGDRFDYPILRAEIAQTGKDLSQDMYCVDSLQAFRNLDRVDEQIVTESESEMPLEFNDNYNEILVKACEDFEQFIEDGGKIEEFSRSKAQKINETTPKKQKIGVYNGNGATNKRNFSSKNIFAADNKSYKLQDIYKRLVTKPLRDVEAHEAEGDVKMLIAISAVYAEKFVAYCNENKKKFCDIPMMTFGRKIGT